MGVYTEMAVKHAADTAPFTEADSFQLALDMQRADHAMFEALIELDFGEIYQEMGIMLVTEADEAEGKKFSINAMKQKIGNAIESIIGLLKKAFGAFMTKWNQLMGRDKPLYDKYKEAFHKNIGDCTLTGYKVPDLSKFESDNSTFASNEKAILTKVINSDIISATTVEAVNEAKSKFVSNTTDIAKKMKEQDVDIYFVEGSADKQLKDVVDAAKFDQYMKSGCKSMIDKFKKDTDAMIKEFESVKALYSKNLGDSDLAKAQLSAISSMITAENSLFTTARSLNISQMKTIYGSVRKIWIAVASGKQAKVKDEKSGEETTQTVNASYVEDLVTLSDLYMEEAFVF